jgi:succinate dehydrogenase/fumarate reductase iron-sulfur protein
VTESVIHILRSDASQDVEPGFTGFTVPHDRDMTVLAALLWIQDHLDGTLAFRYACRGAVCGSCAMAINGELGLACRTHLRDLTKEIFLEPLPNLPILKDLVVDMTSFWEKWARIKPYLMDCDDTPAQERLQPPDDLAQIEQFVNCMLCACCYSACPIQERNPEYMGPAALAALARFEYDSRDRRDQEVRRQVAQGSGIWGCRMAFRCMDVCPRTVRPADGIASLRRHALKDMVTRRKP